MGIRDLQEFIETHCQQACKHVDLVQVARGFALQSRNSKKRGGGTPQQLRLVVDAESCLHKLYGGFFSDWACGGQWNRMMAFLSNLVHTCRASNLDLVVFFNGALEGQRTDEWFQQQADIYKNIQGVIGHIHHKATPPPKAWWVPPPMLSSCLRLALRQLGVSVACSMDDHHQEVIAYCREYSLHGVLAQDADYAVFDPPRYFSAHHLKLTYRGSLETQEYLIDDLAKAIDLHPKRFCILAALLGTHLLPEADLREFFCRICHLSSPAQVAQYPSSEVIRAVISYVRSLPSVDDLDAIGTTVFKNCLGNMNDKVNRFKQSVQYYINGTKEGFFKYRPKIQVSTPVKQPGSYPSKGSTKTCIAISRDESDRGTAERNGFSLETSHVSNLLPSEAFRGLVDESSGYSHSSSIDGAAASVQADETPNDLPTVPLPIQFSSQPNSNDLQQQVETLEISAEKQNGTEVLTTTVAATGAVPVVSASSASPASDASPMPAAATAVITATTSPLMMKVHQSPDQSDLSEKADAGMMKKQQRLVSPEVMNIASERHQKGLMYPWVYQILSQREIKLPISVEDEAYRDLPLATDLYRPLRQRVYGVLSDLSSQLTQWKQQKNAETGKKSKPHVSVKEWVVPRGVNRATSRPYCDAVVAEPLDWTVPDLQRLWLGTTTEDKSYRLKTFLSCMKCDMPQNMLLNIAYVPQQYIILCCVLRYMVMYKKIRIMRPYELDAFLATSVSPLLRDSDTVQEMQLPQVKVRGLHLASLFMSGVEHAIFVNDAVGAPVPWGVTCPWLFFDGKLFHMKLLKASTNVSLLDLCDGYAEQAMYVEKMRIAILNGISVESAFALPSMMIPPVPRPLFPGFPSQHCLNFHPAGGESVIPSYGDRGRGRDVCGITPVDTRGGQLEIAGVVVGSWGANTTAQQRHYGGRNQHGSPPPCIMSVGPHRGVARGTSGGLGRIQNTKKGPGLSKTQEMAKLSYKLQLNAHQLSGRGRGCTVELPLTSDNSTEVKPVLQLMKNSHESSSAVEQLNNGQNVTEEGEAEDAAATTETCDSKSTSTTCQVDATCTSSQLLSTDMICSSSSSQLHPLATTSIPSISGAGETVVEALN